MFWAKKKILVIDDEADLIFFVKKNLEADGEFEVFTATDGRSGIAKAVSKKPDLILLDIIMPYMDGLTVLEILKRQKHQTRTIPVAMLTAKRESKYILQAEKLGIVDYIMKPFTIEELKKMINRHV